MKVTIELNSQEEMTVLETVTKNTSKITDKAIQQYFKNITQSDFETLVRRALRVSFDAFFQNFMQCYIEERAPILLKKIKKEILKRAQSNTNL